VSKTLDSPRPDRAAKRFLSVLKVGGALAAADTDGCQELFKALLSEP